MSEEPRVAELKLDAITKTVRVLAAAPPKIATRVALGVTLAVDDCSNDIAADLLASKLTEGVRSMATTVGFVASSVSGAVGNRVERASTPEAKAARIAMVNRIPGFTGAKAFVSQVTTEARETWDAAGTITVQVAPDEAAVLPVTSSDAVPVFTDDPDRTRTMLEEVEDLAITPDLVPTI